MADVSRCTIFSTFENVGAYSVMRDVRAFAKGRETLKALVDRKKEHDE